MQCLAASQSGALREGPEGDGPDHADLDALGSGRGDGILCHPGRDAEGDDAKRRVLHTIGFIHRLSRLDLAVFFKAFKIFLLQLLRLQAQGVDDIMGPLHFRAGGSPTAVKVPGRDLRQLHRLHHLAHRPVGQDHGDHSVLVRQIKALDRQAGHLLDRRRGQDDLAHIAVAAALDGLEIIRLGGLDPAQARAAALDIDDQRREVARRDIGQALALQRDAGAGAGGHGPLPSCRRAQDHIDRRQLALCLQEHAADLRHTLCHIGRDLCLRGDGIAEIMTAAGADGRFRNGFVALHQYFFRHYAHLSTVMTQSGHIVAQNAQPTQALASVTCAGWWPFALSFVLSNSTICLGQALTHRPQPLQTSVKNVTVAIFPPPK